MGGGKNRWQRVEGTAELEETVGNRKEGIPQGGHRDGGEGLVGQWQHTQRPWGQAEAGAGTNSSDLTRRLDLVLIFQKTNGQMLQRVPDALNLFFF